MNSNMMELPKEIVGIISGCIANIAGIAVIATGLGLTVIPSTLPLLGSAAQIASVIYFVVGGTLITLGCITLYSTFQSSLGNSSGHGRLGQ